MDILQRKDKGNYTTGEKLTTANNGFDEIGASAHRI
jgi:hypothetical protein